MASNHFDYVVVGGGIAGLYCAFHLARKFEKEKKTRTIAVFEATDRLGGRIETWRINGEAAQNNAENGNPGAASDIVPISKLLEADENLEHLMSIKPSERADTDQSAEIPTENDRADKIRKLKQERDSIDLLTAEFGPMRFEPDRQPYLSKLFIDLGIGKERPGQEQWSDLVIFPPYQSPAPDQPSFTLEDEEAAQKNLIDLLLLALRRVFEVIELPSRGPKDGPWLKDEPWWNINPIEAGPYAGTNFEEANFAWQEFRNSSHLSRRFWKRSLMQWIKLLGEPEYRYIFDHATFRKTPLKDVAFWNVLSSVLSHMATTKLRDWASFYHLLPENPSAAAWVTFWLRNIKTSNSLKGIRGGTDFIIHLLCKKLEFTIAKHETEHCHYVTYDGRSESINNRPALFLNRRLLEVRQDQEGENPATYLKFDGNDGKVKVTGHVILALPKAALQRIKFSCNQNPQINQSLQILFDSVISVPLLKCFFLVDQPFWPEDRGANVYAHTAPTRELHYKTNKDGNVGLMMIYTDRPALNYWSELNWPDFKNDPGTDETSGSPGLDLSDLPGDLVVRNRYQAHAKIWKWSTVVPHAYANWKNQKFGNDRLLRTFLLYAKEEGADDLTAERLLQAGMHDWGLRPHENACHAWRAGSEATKIIEYFSEFSLGNKTDGPEKKTLHICGEAYSDYQAFMEGSLRSAFLTLARILEREGIKIRMEEFTKAENVLRTVNYPS